MSGPVSFVLHHPYLVLFGVVLAEQLGLPVPAMPFLLGAGALVGMNKLHPVSALACAVLASLLADLAWYEAGRRRGVLDPEAPVPHLPRARFLRAPHRERLREAGRAHAALREVPPWPQHRGPAHGGHDRHAPLPVPALGRPGRPPLGGGLLPRGPRLRRPDRARRRARCRLRRPPRGGRSSPSSPSGSSTSTPSGSGSSAASGSPASRPEELKQRMDAGEDIVVVDLRAPSTSSSSPRGSREPFASPPTTSRRGTTRSRATVTWCSTALDPTRPRAPGWRSCSSSAASCGCGRCSAASPPGRASPSPSKADPDARAFGRGLESPHGPVPVARRRSPPCSSAGHRPDGRGAGDVGGPRQEAGRLRVGNILMIGSSGSGKTTLMRAVEAILAADPGARRALDRRCASTPTCSARRPSWASPGEALLLPPARARAPAARARDAPWRAARAGEPRPRVRRRGGQDPQPRRRARSNVAGIRAQEALLTLIENEAVPFTLPDWAGGNDHQRRLERPAVRLRRRLRGPLRRGLPPGDRGPGQGRA